MHIIYAVLSHSTNSYIQFEYFKCVCFSQMESNVTHIDVTSTRSRINHFWHSRIIYELLFASYHSHFPCRIFRFVLFANVLRKYLILIATELKFHKMWSVLICVECGRAKLYRINVCMQQENSIVWFLHTLWKLRIYNVWSYRARNTLGMGRKGIWKMNGKQASQTINKPKNQIKR